MPYYHRGCNGVVPMKIPIKCKHCGKKWPAHTMFAPKPPKDMYFAMQPKHLPKGDTKYAKWGDNIPGVSAVASHLPNWPRWARVLAGSGIIVGLIFLIRYLVGLFN